MTKNLEDRLGGVVVFTALLLGNVDGAAARPTYLKVFSTAYPQVAANNPVRCTVCHDGAAKQDRNNYGTALARHVATREQDEAKIRLALQLTEPEPSAIPGKTFGDLLKLGLLPASKRTGELPEE